MAVRGGAGCLTFFRFHYQFILLETQAIPFFQYTTLKGLPFFQVPTSALAGNKLRSTYLESNAKRKLRRTVEP